jgi:hypothetical protein
MLLCVLTMAPGGCTIMQHDNPGRHMPSNEMLNSIATVAVLEPGISVSHTGLSMYDQQVLDLIEAGAVAGTGRDRRRDCTN